MPRLTSITSRTLTPAGAINAVLEPEYSISLDQSSYDEGEVVTATVTALRVDDGVTVDYTVSGMSSSDISAGTLTGTATINSATAIITWTLAEDGLTEGTDTFTVTLASADSAGNLTNSATDSATVNDTSFDPTATPWLDDNDDIVTVRSIIGSTSMTFNGEFATNPSVPIDIEGRTTGTTTTITAITANTGTFFEVNDTGNSTAFQLGEEVNLLPISGFVAASPVYSFTSYFSSTNLLSFDGVSATEAQGDAQENSAMRVVINGSTSIYTYVGMVASPSPDDSNISLDAVWTLEEGVDILNNGNQAVSGTFEFGSYS